MCKVQLDETKYYIFGRFFFLRAFFRAFLSTVKWSEAFDLFELHEFGFQLFQCSYITMLCVWNDRDLQRYGNVFIYFLSFRLPYSKLGSDAPRYKQVKNLLKSQSALSKLLQGCLIQVPLPYSNSDASGASKEMALYNTSRFYYCSIVLVGIPHTFFFSKVYKSYVPNVLQILARGGDRFYSRGKEGRQQLELSL